MATTRSGPLDVLVGARIRMCRLDRGMSQTVLAARIGVTFQQLQKFERGTNRVGAGRLSLIAAALDVSVGELFETPGVKSSGLSLPMRLLKAHARTTDPRARLGLASSFRASPIGHALRRPRLRR
jgi:transcriptional regulator with XRE-family HTH domain